MESDFFSTLDENDNLMEFSLQSADQSNKIFISEVFIEVKYLDEVFIIPMDEDYNTFQSRKIANHLLYKIVEISCVNGNRIYTNQLKSIFRLWGSYRYNPDTNSFAAHFNSRSGIHNWIPLLVKSNYSKILLTLITTSS